jgi:predicted phage tail protein
VQIRANAFENEAPEVTITAPADNSSVAAHTDLTITANASDDKGNPKVSFFANDHFLGSVTAPPYSLVWSNVPAGTFALFARAQDAFGKSGISSAVHISVTNPPPAGGSIQLTLPTAKSSFAAGSNIDVAATVTGNDNVTSVSFLANDKVIGAATTAPYTFTWSNVPAGYYLLRAKATDSTGGTLVSTAVPIRVTNTPPTVTITAPADKTTVDAGANVDISATATSGNGPISNVTIYGDGHLLGKLTAEPYSVTWSNVPPGIHKIIAVGVDSIGAVGYSVVTITASNTPPTVKLTSPADGATFTAPAKIDLAADASDSNGIRYVVFWRGSYPIALKSSPPYTTSTTIMAPGTYKFVAEAYDVFGARTKSDPITVTVTAP